MDKVKAVILAAGKGTRMKSELPKVLHKVNNKTMVDCVIEAAIEAGVTDICLVVGYKGDLVKEQVNTSVDFVVQEEQLGTGHAVKCAKSFIGTDGNTFVLCGDTPLIKGETLKALLKQHLEEQNGITVLSTILEDSTGYGRIIRDAEGNFVKSVEEKDATEEERMVKEVNSGMYIFDSKILYESLDLISNNNAQKEYYLPDTLAIVKAMGEKQVGVMVTKDISEIKGVNSQEQLKEAEEIINKRKKKINNKANNM